MKIVLINHYAGSDKMGMAYRPFYLAREWRLEGHDTTIVAASFSHLRAHQPTARTNLAFTEEEGVCFRWMRTNRYVGSGMARALNVAMFAGKLLAYAERIAREERPDLVICGSTYPLDINGGARIATAANARLVFEVQDLWPLTPIMLGNYSPYHPLIRLLQHAEDWAYRRADKVVSALPNACGYMVEHGLDPRKFVYIPNGIPIARGSAADLAPLPGALPELIDQAQRRGHFLVGYAGGITLSMDVETLVEAAQHLASQSVTFIIVGDGPDARSLRRRIGRMGLTNVHMPGRIPKLAVPHFLSRMDALALPWRRSPLYRYGVSPNKLFDYMLAGKPILQAGDVSNDLVAEVDCGFTVAPEDPASFADAILRLRAQPKDNIRRGENGRNFVMKNHDYRVLARRYLAEVA